VSGLTPLVPQPPQMRTNDSDRSAVTPPPGKARETGSGYATSDRLAAPGSARHLIELQRSVGNAAVSQLVARHTRTYPRAIQRGVYAEAGAKAVAVPHEAKTHAIWVTARDQPGGKLDSMIVPFVINAGTPAQRTINKFEKYKGRWFVGHMVFANKAQPDHSRLPLSDTYREYDVHEYRPPAARDAERVVIGRTSRRKWYTDNHYADFTEFA
jgi:hypothetical protein